MARPEKRGDIQLGTGAGLSRREGGMMRINPTLEARVRKQFVVVGGGVNSRELGMIVEARAREIWLHVYVLRAEGSHLAETFMGPRRVLQNQLHWEYRFQFCRSVCFIWRF